MIRCWRTCNTLNITIHAQRAVSVQSKALLALLAADAIEKQLKFCESVAGVRCMERPK